MRVRKDLKVFLLAGAAMFTGGAAGAQTASNTTIEEIIVTATRQSVALSKVPISVAAFDNKALDTRSIHNVVDLVRQTPGIDVSTRYTSPMEQRIAIRGIDSTAGAPTTAVYIDDLPIQAPVGGLNYAGSTVPQVFDLDRVEVLRGPQGTLFGASAEGGSVRFITPTPSLSKTSLYVKSSVGQVKDGGRGGELGVAFGAPIVEEKLGVRASYSHRWDPGYVDRVNWATGQRFDNANAGEVDVARAAIQIKPTEWLSIQPSVFFQHYTIGDSPMVWRGLSDLSAGKFVNGFAVRQKAVDKYTLPSLRVVATGDNLEFTAVTSLMQREQHQNRDQTNLMGGAYLGKPYPRLADGTVVTNIFTSHARQRNFAQEFRLTNTNPDARLRWQAGVFYSVVRQRAYGVLAAPAFDRAFKETYGISAERFFGAPLVDGVKLYDGDQFTRERQLAGFVNLDFKLTPELTLTVAGRYGVDKINYTLAERDPSFGTTATSFNAGEQKEKPFTPKFALSWQRTPDQLIYASLSKGFRAGGVNSTLPKECASALAAIGYSATPRTYDSDSTWSYEVGNKSRLLGGRLAIDSSAFYIKWKNIQQSLRLGCLYSLTLNSGEADSKGFDVNLNFRATSDLSVGGSVGYTDANYTKTIRNAAGVIALDGQTLGVAPWSLEAWLEYRFNAFGRPSSFRIQDNYKSRNNGLHGQQIAASPTYDRRFEVDRATNSLDIRLGHQVGEVDLALVGQNLLNQHARFTTMGLAYTPDVLENFQRPRYVGLEAIVRY